MKRLKVSLKNESILKNNYMKTKKLKILDLKLTWNERIL